ncbi:Translation initiation factor IF-2 [Candidatus Cyrtobacter comes]|uniref:Translation initiation factor IF-2 n=1 Tax=Candidatus Cyrtobacter comes TaxID=675776 RepID=A0ABU5L7R7_9RICK|nr:translation initiation factor IF-2 [Candidatus Cyrtobacter comes]MDZ5761945.1 Translation initiation factor IF-2 [Candidatus Cyrtobacter comes]
MNKDNQIFKRKQLGIGGAKLGPGDTVKSEESVRTFRTPKPSVIVITKQHNKTKSQTSFSGLLTEEEKRRRLEILKANIERKKNLEQVRDQLAVDENVDADAAHIAIEAVAESYDNTEFVKKSLAVVESLKAVEPVSVEPVKDELGGAVDSKHSIQEDKKGLKRKTDKESEDLLKISKAFSSKRTGRKISLSQIQITADELGDDITVEKKLKLNKKKGKKFGGKNLAQAQQEQKNTLRVIEVPDSIAIQDLAAKMSAKATKLLAVLLKLGIKSTINQYISYDVAELLVEEFGHISKKVSSEIFEKELLDNVQTGFYREVREVKRAPVVTVMGHVDHGKTSLLDALKSTDVASGEHGGITQHIGAYNVILRNGKSITFLDTPGHEAFTKMRIRGAKVTDMVILVVAADDGIKEQTVEAISHAKAANSPIIVAVNKMDKPGANFQAVKNALLAHNVVSDDMGGDVMVVGVSAKTKVGLDELEEAILLQADFMDLKATIGGKTSGVVIESKMDKGRGAVATLLVQEGVLEVGSGIVAGTSMGKIKTLRDHNGNSVTSAIPSIPVEVLGLDKSPAAGDKFVVFSDESKAKALVDFRMNVEKEKRFGGMKSPINIFENRDNAKKELSLILKADVHGSLEAIKGSLEAITSDEWGVKIIHMAVGGITESDISLASATASTIVMFNVRNSSKILEKAKSIGIEVRGYNIIYDLINDVKVMIGGMLSPLIKEALMGKASVKQIFNLTKFGKIAGCIVNSGVFRKDLKARVIRGKDNIFEGQIKNLKRFTEEVKEVNTGFEFGISLDGFSTFEVGDIVEAISVSEEARVVQ